MVAALAPGSRLVRHRDPVAGSLRYHLGLITANSDDCCIYVDGEKYFWRDGESVVFDETYIHYAENKTGQTRVILFCDIERPLRFEWARRLNRWFGRCVMSQAAAPNWPGDRTGLINKIFPLLYAVRRRGKALKARRRAVYYFIKSLLAGVIVCALGYWLVGCDYDR
jgi:beta-hydroxylase